MPPHKITDALKAMSGHRPTNAGGLGQTVAPDLTHPHPTTRGAPTGLTGGPFVLLARLSAAHVDEGHRGPEAAEACLRHLQAMEQAVIAHWGVIVRSTAHEVAGLFESLDAALLAACQMLRPSGEPAAAGDAPAVHAAIDVLAGFGRRHLDDCLEALTGLSLVAWPGQIVAGPGAAAALPQTWQAACRERGVARIRGRALPLLEILWRDVETSGEPSQTTPAVEPAAMRLHLRHGDRDCLLGSDTAPVRIGRAADATIVVADHRSSREHARIEWRDSHFVLRDQSLNGTFVRFGGRSVFQLKHDEAILFGTGTFHCGHDGGAEPQAAVMFEILWD